jgi:hypothetical protein
MKQQIARRLKREDGTAILETAFLASFLILLLLGAVDFGRAYYVAIEVSSAAHEAALYGSQNFTDTAGMETVAASNASDVSTLVATATYGCECYDGSSSSALCAVPPASCPIPSGSSTSIGNIVYYVQVNTTATYNALFNYPGIPGSLSFRGQARMRVDY